MFEYTLESPNLTDLQLVDLDYDRLDQLTELRRRAAAFRGTVLVRYVHLPDREGYAYGVTYPGDFPFWRGTLEEAAGKIDELAGRVG
jgi:hypothetical protein